MRVALYARYSDDKQNDKSAQDQLAELRTAAAAKGWQVAAEYADEAISGAAVLNRPAVLRLLADAAARRFDVVYIEALDRLSRGQADSARIYELLDFHGISIETLSRGVVTELNVGLEGTMNRLFLVELGKKTRRGLVARVKAGFSGGGRCYGYEIPAKGELAIDETEAGIVRRVFQAYADGDSPRSIAHQLNAEGVPGPRGGEWTAATINGDRRAQDGMLHNELYIGVRVFNRRRFRKHPETGARTSVLNPPELWMREPVPHLRILDDPLWAAVQARKAALADQPRAYARKPKRLLSGLVACGCCGGAMTLQGNRYACSTHRERGTCTNNRIVAADAVERRVVEGIRKNLLAPDVVERAIRAYHDERAAEEHDAQRQRLELERELAEAERRRARAWEAWDNEMMSKEEFKRRMAEISAVRERCEAGLAALDAPQPVRLHPRAADHYRTIVEQLGDALTQPDAERVRLVLRKLIDNVTFTPGEGRGQYDLQVAGKLTALLGESRAASCEVLVGAGTRSGRNLTSLEIGFAA